MSSRSSSSPHAAARPRPRGRPSSRTTRSPQDPLTGGRPAQERVRTSTSEREDRRWSRPGHASRPQASAAHSTASTRKAAAGARTRPALPRPVRGQAQPLPGVLDGAPARRRRRRVPAASDRRSRLSRPSDREPTRAPSRWTADGLRRRCPDVTQRKHRGHAGKPRRSTVRSRPVAGPAIAARRGGVDHVQQRRRGPEVHQGRGREVRRRPVLRPAGRDAALQRPGTVGRRGLLHRGPDVRRLLDPRLPGDPRVGHEAHPRPDDGLRRPVPGREDASR